jgi:hypothetical protein
MEPKPAPVGPRNFLGLPKESDEEEKDEIGIDPRLELEVPREIFRSDLSLALFELERGMEGVVDLFHERNQRPDVSIAQARARIVPLQLFDEPARIIDPNVKLIVRAPEKSAGEIAQLAGLGAGEPGEMGAAALIDQAIFQVDPDLRVGPLKQLLDLAEERFVHR